MTHPIEPDRSSPPELRGRIDRRLSVIFGALFALVLFVGGTSLYLLGSLLLKSEDIAKESEQVHVVERVHGTLQDLLFAVERARLQGHALPRSSERAAMTELEGLLALYQAAGAPEASVKEMRQIVADAGTFAERAAGGASIPGATLQADAGLDAVQARIQAFARRISAGHGASEQQQVQRADRELRLTIAVNVAFVVVGTVLLLGARRYFRGAIALPLRRLADRSAAIARGEPDHAMPITSTDEIGRLSQAFNRMATQLREHEERLKGLVTLQERERLARELHDDLAQDLAFLRIKLVEADESQRAVASPGSRTHFRELIDIVDGAYHNLRQAIFGLRALDPERPGGFLPALSDYLHDFSEARKLPVDLRVSGLDDRPLAPEAETQLVRIIHEALTNVAKHAGASRAVVALRRDGDTLSVAIEDDGKGFVVEDASGDGLHFGLKSMRDRAEAVGGRLSVQSAPGRGTRLGIELPLGRT